MVEIPEQSAVSVSHTVQIHMQSPQSDSQYSTTEPGEQENHTREDCAPVGSEPVRGPLDSGSTSTELVLIALRKQQLQNRRAMLLNMQQFRTRAREAVGSSESDEDGSQPCELETIDEELKELAQKEEDLRGQEQRNSVFSELTPGIEKVNELLPCPGIYVLPSHSTVLSVQSPPASVDQEMTHSRYYEANRMIRNGGVYILPPTEEKAVEPDPEGPSTQEQEVPAEELENLGRSPAVVKCASCGEVITTETDGKVGPSMWILCGVCSMFGCVAGCCLIPFFMDSLRDVQHQCPRCHTLLHTFQRL